MIGEGPAREPGDAWSWPDGITGIGAPAELVGGMDPAQMGVSDIYGADVGSSATDNLERTQPTKEAIQHPTSRPSLGTHDRHQRMFLPGVLAGLSGSQVQDARIPHRGWRWVSSAGYALD